MHIFGVIPFIKLQNDKQQLNGEKQWKIRWRAKLLICFWFSYVVFMPSAWKNQVRWQFFTGAQVAVSLYLQGQLKFCQATFFLISTHSVYASTNKTKIGKIKRKQFF